MIFFAPDIIVAKENNFKETIVKKTVLNINLKTI
jgi:hypothetical protein